MNYILIKEVRKMLKMYLEHTQIKVLVWAVSFIAFTFAMANLIAAIKWW